MTDVSAGFRPPCWCSCRWAPAWRLHTNLYKFGENVSSHISHKKNCCDLSLGESLCISTFFLFADSRFNLLHGFDFLFWSILHGVTLKLSNCDPLFQLYAIFASVTHFCKCDPFLQVWPTFPTVTRCFKFYPLCHVWPSVAHCCNCDPCLQMWPVLASVTHFWKNILFSQVSSSFPTVTHFLQVQPIFAQRVPILQVWPTFPTVNHFCKCYPLI